MRYMIIIMLLSGCDPTIYEGSASKRPPNQSLAMAPLCIVLCNTTVDAIGSTNAKGVSNFTGQTSTRTKTSTATGGNQ